MSNLANNKEIEARWVGLDQDEITDLLTKLGADKVGEFFFQEWVFAHPEWRAVNRRIRVRTDGKTTWLTYKSSPTSTVDGTEEIELEVSSAEQMVKILRSADIPQLRHQEKRRHTYKLGSIIFDLDFWPKIPMVFEIEAPTEAEVRQGADLLGLEWDKAIFEDQSWIHKNHYGIDMFKISEYFFEK